MTNSIAFPEIFNVSQNKVAVLSGNDSIVNRDRLLIMTEPTELYNHPDFGVGLKRHLWQYNNENQKAIIKDRIVEQLRLHEPYCIPDKTTFADGLLFTESDKNYIPEYNHLKMTVGIASIYGETLEVTEDGK